jgi:hypothetical protein
MRRFLLISPYFPPSPVIGVKRALNLVRHLPAQGWDPVVLAAPPEGSQRATDLQALVPASTVVSRRYGGPFLGPPAPSRSPSAARSAAESTDPRALRRKFLTPFDRYVWFTPFALAEAIRLVRRHRPEVIVVNADPWSGLLVGHLLHRATGLPWIADLRDPWSLHPHKMALRPAISRDVVRRCEEAFFRSAAKVVLNAESAWAAYVDAYAGRIPTGRFTYIRNAYDETIFEPCAASPPSRFTLSYFGSFKPFVHSTAILEGFARFVSAGALTPESARLQIVGGHVPDAELSRHGLEPYVDRRPSVPLTRAQHVLKASSALMLVVEPNTPLVPGKLYDYLASRRPIVAISDNAEVSGILRETGAGLAVPHGDSAGTAQALDDVFSGRFIVEPDETALRRYSAETQAARFAEVLNAAATRSPPDRARRQG